ncbi:hypothetical protein [Caballeronia sp. RCC_10]|uniref:hypothetical protein n=1 Tax=Caballeronia sp. RCC_10 TaxID=3239227 RepID=UPI0035269006
MYQAALTLRFLGHTVWETIPLLGNAAMRTLRDEEDDLILADRHIAESNERVATLIRLVEREKEAGLDAAECENLVYVMQDVLKTFVEHRQLIIEKIPLLRRQVSRLGDE